MELQSLAREMGLEGVERIRQGRKLVLHRSLHVIERYFLLASRVPCRKKGYFA
jgi:hypothetical protein